MQSASVPSVPGYHGDIKEPACCNEKRTALAIPCC